MITNAVYRYSILFNNKGEGKHNNLPIWYNRQQFIHTLVMFYSHVSDMSLNDLSAAVNDNVRRSEVALDSINSDYISVVYPLPSKRQVKLQARITKRID